MVCPIHQLPVVLLASSLHRYTTSITILNSLLDPSTTLYVHTSHDNNAVCFLQYKHRSIAAILQSIVLDQMNRWEERKEDKQMQTGGMINNHNNHYNSTCIMILRVTECWDKTRMVQFRRLYQCQSKIISTFLSKITKYNRAHLEGDPASFDCQAMILRPDQLVR